MYYIIKCIIIILHASLIKSQEEHPIVFFFYNLYQRRVTARCLALFVYRIQNLIKTTFLLINNSKLIQSFVNWVRVT